MLGWADIFFLTVEDPKLIYPSLYLSLTALLTLRLLFFFFTTPLVGACGGSHNCVICDPTKVESSYHNQKVTKSYCAQVLIRATHHNVTNTKAAISHKTMFCGLPSSRHFHLITEDQKPSQLQSTDAYPHSGSQK